MSSSSSADHKDPLAGVEITDQSGNVIATETISWDHVASKEVVLISLDLLVPSQDVRELDQLKVQEFAAKINSSGILQVLF